MQSHATPLYCDAERLSHSVGSHSKPRDVSHLAGRRIGMRYLPVTASVYRRSLVETLFPTKCGISAPNFSPFTPQAEHRTWLEGIIGSGWKKHRTRLERTSELIGKDIAPGWNVESHPVGNNIGSGWKKRRTGLEKNGL